MYLGGFIACWLGMRWRAKAPWSKVRPEQVDDVVFYSALGAILGGRIGYMLVYGHADLVRDPLSIFRVWEGGMSFHGGFGGVLVAMAIYARRIRQPFFAVMDFIAPWAPTGLFLGRVGNFINGELWGKPTSPDAPWSVIVDGVARHPSQLYEAFLEGVVLLVVLLAYTAKPRPVMATSGLFLIGYGAFRVLVEFVRLPDEEIGYIAFGWLTTGQLLSAPMVVAGVILFVLAHRRAAPAAQPGRGPRAARRKAA
jgi:phosphatidylglycerol:prolipoprotein diacylglycerol transferase